jgi:hypothetical protein
LDLTTILSENQGLHQACAGDMGAIRDDFFAVAGK